MVEVMRREDIYCPECDCKDIDIFMNESPDVLLCECNECNIEFRAWVINLI